MRAALAEASEPKTLPQLSEQIGAGQLELFQSMRFGLMDDVLARVGGNITHDISRVRRALRNAPDDVTFASSRWPVARAQLAANAVDCSWQEGAS